MDLICKPELCTGCFACVNACSLNAISMVEESIGHIYPKIDTTRCMDCGKCQKTCPANNPPELLIPKTTYAAWATDSQEHSTSTSGGVAAVLSNMIIAEGGVVYGCVLKDGKIKHVRADKSEDLFQFKGSKYVHSHLENTLREIKADIKSGHKVLFIGTPCQVAAVKNFIRNTDQLLLTVDLICHGVPPQRILFDYLAYKEFNHKEIRTLSFREKKGYFLTVSDSVKKYHVAMHKDLFYMGFFDNLFFRDSCYTCRYSTANRVGDLTIGDFWGLGRKQPFNCKPNGNVSVILVNSCLGEEAIAQCQTSEALTLEERTLEEAVAGNHNLQTPSVCANKDKFKSIYASVPLHRALKRCLRKRRLKSLILPLYQQIQRILG